MGIIFILSVIEFSITILLTKFSSDWRSSLISRLSKNFQVEKSLVSDEETFIHVFYRPRKYFTDYFPLFVSYFLCSVGFIKFMKKKFGFYRLSRTFMFFF